MTDQKAGFQIGARFYPFPQAFRLGDPILVEELTGLVWDAFLERLPDDDDPDDVPADPAAMLGLLGVAVWQQNPTWRRDRVIRYCQGLEMSAVEAVGPDADEDGEDRPPETREAGSNSSELTASASASASDSHSET